MARATEQTTLLKLSEYPRNVIHGHEHHQGQEQRHSYHVNSSLNLFTDCFARNHGIYYEYYSAAVQCRCRFEFLLVPW